MESNNQYTPSHEVTLGRHILKVESRLGVARKTARKYRGRAERYEELLEKAAAMIEGSNVMTMFGATRDTLIQDIKNALAPAHQEATEAAERRALYIAEQEAIKAHNTDSVEVA